MVQGMASCVARSSQAGPNGPNGPDGDRLRNGSIVEINGLKSAAEYNGLQGQIRSYDRAKQRYVVTVRGKPIALKAANLVATSTPSVRSVPSSLPPFLPSFLPSYLPFLHFSLCVSLFPSPPSPLSLPQSPPTLSRHCPTMTAIMYSGSSSSC